MSRRRRGVHEDLLDEVGICQRQRHRSTPGTPSLWETIRPKEAHEAAEERHLQARLLCQQCPLLRPCEQMLSDMEKAAQPVDGVVAGRWSDCIAETPRVGVPRQDTCRACKQQMRPQRSPRPISPRSRIVRRHVGEGLCHECAPNFKRWKS